MKTIDIEAAIFKHWCGKNKKAIIPNVSWGFLSYECDLLVVEKDLTLTEIEIKVSKSDLKADLKKPHKHNSNMIKRLYFAIPDYMYTDDCIELIPERAGILTVGIQTIPHLSRQFYVVENRRNPVLNKSCNYELTTKHLHTLLYLQTFRLNKHYSNELKSRQIKIKL